MKSNKSRTRKHTGFLIQEAAGVRFALVGASYFVPHLGATPVGKSADDVATDWKPDGSEVHAAIVSPSVAPCTSGSDLVGGPVVAEFEYEVGARTDEFVEVFAKGEGLTGTLIFGKKAMTLTQHQLPYVLTPEAVEKGWMPPAGESGLPKALELDIAPNVRWWRPEEGVDPKAIRDYVVKSGYVSDENVMHVEGDLRRVEWECTVSPWLECEDDRAGEPPALVACEDEPSFSDVLKSLDPDAGPKANVRLVKSETEEEEQRYVLGVVLEPETTDSQNEIYSAEEIRKSAWNFITKYRNVGLQHRYLMNGHIEIVESYIAPTDMTVEGQEIKKGTWMMGLHVRDDKVWEAVKDGTLTGLSIGGYGILKPDTETTE